MLWSWLVAGSAATTGLFWLVLAALRSSLGPSSVVIAAVSSALASGALMASHAPVKPTREPLLAGAIGCGLVFATQLAMIHANGWQTYTDPVWMQITSVVLGGASGAGGAAAMRRHKGVSSSALSVMVLSGAVSVGVLMTFSIFSPGLETPIGLLVMLAGVIGSGSLTQYVVPFRAPWASASGILLLPVFTWDYGQGVKDGELVPMILGLLLLVLLGRIGSGLANRLVAKPNASGLPTARASDR